MTKPWYQRDAVDELLDWYRTASSWDKARLLARLYRMIEAGSQ